MVMSEGILFDYARKARIGLPEVVFCEGKPLDSLAELMRYHGRSSQTPALFTRLSPEVFEALPEDARSEVTYHPLSKVAFGQCLEAVEGYSVAIVSAGTSDAFVAWEAAMTLRYLGIGHDIFEDYGVAGLWRITQLAPSLEEYQAVIVVAGLDAALASVVGGLTSKPLIAVPTSVGYGVAYKGQAALASMLTSCAPGVSVMNIDNGFGAACAAARIIHTLKGCEEHWAKKAGRKSD